MGAYGRFPGPHFWTHQKIGWPAQPPNMVATCAPLALPCTAESPGQAPENQGGHPTCCLIYSLHPSSYAKLFAEVSTIAGFPLTGGVGLSGAVPSGPIAPVFSVRDLTYYPCHRPFVRISYISDSVPVRPGTRSECTKVRGSHTQNATLFLRGPTFGKAGTGPTCRVLPLRLCPVA